MEVDGVPAHGYWGADGPAGPRRTPTFIVSHSRPDDVPASGVQTFASSPEPALEAVREFEAKLGVELVHRTTRRVELSDAGARLRES